MVTYLSLTSGFGREGLGGVDVVSYDTVFLCGPASDEQPSLG